MTFPNTGLLSTPMSFRLNHNQRILTVGAQNQRFSTFWLQQVKLELERVKSAMVQVKTVQDKEKRNRVNVDAAERFIASAIWNPGEAKKRKSDVAETEETTKRPK